MATNASIYQQARTVSIPRDEFLDRVIENENLSKTDLRVLLLLLTHLNGWSQRPRQQDPLNFTKIDPEEMANTLGLTKKKVNESIGHLVDEDIIEKGRTSAMKNGYRFTF